MRLIDADALMEGRVDDDPVVIAAMCAKIVDAVPVVRCKDCKHSYENCGDLICGHGPCRDHLISDSFFYCLYGSKMDLEDNK